MGLFDTFKMRGAVVKQKNGDLEGAKAAYQQFYDSGLIMSYYILPWAVLLLREGKQESLLKVKQILGKCQKAPDLNESSRTDLLLYYAVAQWLLGEREKAVELLEKAHQKNPVGNTYAALGYMYIEAKAPEQALEFNLNALEYDDEDPVILDNVGQTYYRVLNDPEKAKGYFDQAYTLKDSQVDTLWFLSRYDLENGDTAAAIQKLEKAAEGRFAPLNFKKKPEIEAELNRLKNT